MFEKRFRGVREAFQTFQARFKDNPNAFEKRSKRVPERSQRRSRSVPNAYGGVLNDFQRLSVFCRKCCEVFKSVLRCFAGGVLTCFNAFQGRSEVFKCVTQRVSIGLLLKTGLTKSNATCSKSSQRRFNVFPEVIQCVPKVFRRVIQRV